MHPANYGKGILNHQRHFAFSKHRQVLCALDTSGTLLEVSGMRCFNYIATVARDANSSAQIGKRAIDIFQGAELCLFFFRNEIFFNTQRIERNVASQGESILYLVRYRNKMFKRSKTRNKMFNDTVSDQLPSLFLLISNLFLYYIRSCRIF